MRLMTRETERAVNQITSSAAVMEPGVVVHKRWQQSLLKVENLMRSCSPYKFIGYSSRC
jgi:hypothetical protein